jgi:hypothetical protein
MAHGQWTEIEARGVLEAWKKSGQSLEGYARSRGLVPQRLHGARLMFGLPPSVRIYFAAELVDMRKGIDGLRALVEGALKKDPHRGHLFVFIGKSKDKVKILYWDRNGFVPYLKRLERGRSSCRLSTGTPSTWGWSRRSSQCYSTASISTPSLARWNPSDKRIDPDRRP